MKRQIFKVRDKNYRLRRYRVFDVTDNPDDWHDLIEYTKSKLSPEGYFAITGEGDARRLMQIRQFHPAGSADLDCQCEVAPGSKAVVRKDPVNGFMNRSLSGVAVFKTSGDFDEWAAYRQEIAVTPNEGKVYRDRLDMFYHTVFHYSAQWGRDYTVNIELQGFLMEHQCLRPLEASPYILLGDKNASKVPDRWESCLLYRDGWSHALRLQEDNFVVALGAASVPPSPNFASVLLLCRYIFENKYRIVDYDIVGRDDKDDPRSNLGERRIDGEDAESDPVYTGEEL
jgi:hypothetical protein